MIKLEAFIKEYPQEYKKLRNLAEDINNAVGRKGLAIILKENAVVVIQNYRIAASRLYSASICSDLMGEIDITLGEERMKWKQAFMDLWKIGDLGQNPLIARCCKFGDACVSLQYYSDISRGHDIVKLQRFAYTGTGYDAFACALGQLSVLAANQQFFLAGK